MLVDIALTLLVDIFINSVLTPLNALDPQVLAFMYAFADGLESLLASQPVRVLLGLSNWTIVGAGFSAWLTVFVLAVGVKLVLTVVGIVTGRAG